MVAVHQISGVLKTKETAQMTQIAFLDWYVVAKTAQKIRGLVIGLTAVSSFLTYSIQVCLNLLSYHCNTKFTKFENLNRKENRQIVNHFESLYFSSSI